MPRKTNPRKTNPSSSTMLGGAVAAGSDRVHLHFPKTVYPPPSPLSPAECQSSLGSAPFWRIMTAPDGP
jgi:hypothetical protein